MRERKRIGRVGVGVGEEENRVRVLSNKLKIEIKMKEYRALQIKQRFFKSVNIGWLAFAENNLHVNWL